MTAIATTVSRLGGVARRRELESAGFSGAQIAGAVRSNAIRRARIGWYVGIDIEETCVSAIRVGGRLASLSAARSYGLWVPPFEGIHVSVSPGQSRFRSVPPEVHLLWDGHQLNPSPRTRVSLLDTLTQVATHEPGETCVSVVDSALNQGLVTLADVEGIGRRIPRRKLASLALVDALSESGIETLARVRLRAIGLDPRVQVAVASGVRVDLMLNDSLVIELDGRETHTGVEYFERDRQRDAVLNAAGYRVLHFSYRQVMYDWASVESTILLVLRQPSTRHRVILADQHQR